MSEYSTNADNPTYFPPQKISNAARTKQWYIDCVRAGEKLIAYGRDYEDHRKMQIWENLDNDIIDQQEIERVFNPMQIENASFPAAIKNYPLSVPKIDLLQGEEIKRKFDWNVIAKNENSHSSYTKALRDEILNIMIEQIQAEAMDEEKLQKDIEEVSKYYEYDFKDLNEISATRVLQYLWREQTLKHKFTIGFRDALIKGREVYRIDIVGGEPTVERVDPQRVYFVRKPNNHKIEESDIIVEINYEPIGKVIDEFHDELTSAEVTEIETRYGALKNRESSSAGTLNHVNGFPLMLVGTEIGGDNPNDFTNQLVTYALPYDYEGNVRVVRTRWLGRRKMGRLKFYNPVTGDEDERLVSENYKPNTAAGESVKWFWVNESMKGTCIANSIYVGCGPSEVQMRHIDNPSKCFLGYVGTDYGKSLMSRMEPYQYLYNVYMRRLELAISRYSGPIQEIDFSMKPADWSVNEWMFYQDVLGKYVVDSFNEGQSGAARGKLAGAVNNTSGRIMDANPGNYIRELINMLQYIEIQMGEIAGVSKQRQGSIDNRETVGGIERAVTQSSHITEKWFYVHDETKKRVMAALLDTAKQTWKNSKSKRISFIMEDMSRKMIEFNGDDFASSEYDLFITNSSEDQEIREALKQLAQAAVQNGASLTLPITILRSDSITEMAKKIEAEERERFAREQQSQQQTIEAQERMQQAELADKQADRDLKYYDIDERSRVALEVAGMKAQETEPTDNTTEQQKIAIAERKQQHEETKTFMEQNLKNRQLSETERHNKAAESIAKSRPRSTSK